MDDDVVRLVTLTCNTIVAMDRSILVFMSAPVACNSSVLQHSTHGLCVCCSARIGGHVITEPYRALYQRLVTALLVCLLD